MSLRSLAKKIIAYSIEDEYKVYRLRHTPLAYRYQFTTGYHKLYDKVPISKNKIVFDNYMGGGYGCNCKYVLKELLGSCPDFVSRLDLVWITRDAGSKGNLFPKEVRLVEYGSEEAFGEYATAAIWVNNFQMVHYLNKGLLKREGQTYIQMWHGSFGIKKIEGSCDYLNADKPWTVLAKKNAAYTDYWISNSDFESEVYKEAFWGAGDILEYGHPRNDLFFMPTEEISAKVRSRHGLKNQKIVMYVPTFRDKNKSEVSNMNTTDVLKSLKKRFGGEWIFALRNHPRMALENTGLQMENVVDVTDYPDIQELLAASDVVITDYSSAIFDFMLTGRPGFLLAEDYEKYKDFRGLYYPLEETPFPLARSGEELLENIECFDEVEYKESVRAFLAEKGSKEDGNAAKRVVCLIKQIIDKDEKND